MKQFKIRPSAIGQIMTQPRTKADQAAGKLSQTAATYCDNWLKEQLYNCKKDFSSMETSKGTRVENTSIKLIASALGYGMLFKNEDLFENDYCKGTPDILAGDDTVIDAKSPFSPFTFPLFETEIDKSYWWQLQGYMWITGRKKARLVYALTNTPEDIIERITIAKVRDEMAEADQVAKIADEVRKAHTFDHIPEALRVHALDFDRDEDAIAQIAGQVLKCRKHIANRYEFLKHEGKIQ